MLQKMGYQSDIAGDGLEAIDAVKRQSYDIILMDVQMPELDGLEATKRIRSDDTIEIQPIIYAMTAGVSAIDQEHCFSAGMDGFIRKPVKFEDFSIKMEEAEALRDKQLKEIG